MRSPRRILSWCSVVILLGFATSSVVRGQGEGAKQDESLQLRRDPGRKKDERPPLEDALETRAQGRLHDAIPLFDAVAGDPAASPGDRLRALRGLVDARFATGTDREAEERVRELGEDAGLSGAPGLAAIHARIALARGRLDRAEKLARDGWLEDPSSVEAHALLAEILEARGEEASAARHWHAVERIASERVLEGTGPLMALAKAYRALGRLEDAVEVLQDVLHDDPEALEPRLLLARLFLQGYDELAPLAIARKADALHPEHPGPQVVLARVYTFREDPAASAAALREALRRNPRDVEALFLDCLSRVSIRDFSRARASRDALADVAPQRAERWVLDALLAHLEPDPHAFEKARAAVAAKGDAARVLLATTLGDSLAALYRFADAVPFYEEALAIWSHRPSTWIALARSLLSTGKEDRARKALERSRKEDGGFQHKWRHNMLQVLDRLARDVERDAGTFRILLAPEEAGVYGPMLEDLLRKAEDDFALRTGIRPRGPVRVEVFDRHADFSVRTTGFGDFGALGACFGPVVTLLSPRSELRRQFVWGATAWHEYSHVLTLQESRHRIPRWLTEGMAVAEEGRHRPEWARESDFQVYNALRAGTLLSIGDLEQAFRSSRILYAYAQAGSVARFLEERHGLPALFDVLHELAKDHTQDEALRAGLGQDTEEIDTAYKAHLEERYAGVRLYPFLDDAGIVALRREAARHEDDPRPRIRLAWGHFRRGEKLEAGAALQRALRLDPDIPDARLLEGAMDLAQGEEDAGIQKLQEAFEAGASDALTRARYAQQLVKAGEQERALSALEKSIEEFGPLVYPGPEEPRRARIHLLDAMHREDEALVAIEALCAIDEKEWDGRVRLAEAAEKSGKLERAERYWRELLFLDPFTRKAHVGLARVLRGEKEWEEALEQFDRALKIVPEDDFPPLALHGPAREARDRQDQRDRAGLRCDRAEILETMGRFGDAIREVREALTVDPQSRRAQDILLRLGGAGAADEGVG